MISNVDPASELFLANLDRIQQRIAEASRQVSSGRRIAQPSDAPDQIGTLLQIRADQERNKQIQSSLSIELTHVQAADGAIASGIQLLDRARVLAAEGANSTATDQGRKAMADEVQSLLDQMIACSRTAVQGHYIFSGDADGTPPYQADSTSPTGAAALVSAPATRQIQNPSGGLFLTSKTAQEIFDSRNADGTPATGNVFAALNGLRAGLLAGDLSAIGACATQVQAADDSLNSAQAFYGAAQGRITDAQSYAERYDGQLETQLSQAQDADVVAAALTLSQSRTQLDAALQMRAALPRHSLFDFLG